MPEITTHKLILSINAGSSSVKLSLYSASGPSTEPPQLLVESSISGLTSPPATFSYAHATAPGSASNVSKQELPDGTTQDSGFEHFLSHLAEDASLAEIHGSRDIAFACHRIVHGGDFPKAMVLSRETIKELQDLSDLAPLHNAAALALVRTALRQLPAAKNIAYFDTTFHRTLPSHVTTYALDRSLAQRKKMRKYGFHGISYAFILRAAAGYLRKPAHETSLIALHLGSGASAAAIRRGRSVDTSMGLTPLEGLPGATRSGSVDPSLVFHYTSDAGSLSRASTRDMHLSRAEQILNNESGWRSLVGTADFAHVTEHMHGDETCRLAFDIVVDRIAGFVGSYFVKLHGDVDALVFAGGIGERSHRLRAAVVDSVACLGFRLEKARNERAAAVDGTVVGIGGERVGDRGCARRVLVVRTDEQAEMATECAADESFW